MKEVAELLQKNIIMKEVMEFLEKKEFITERQAVVPLNHDCICTASWHCNYNSDQGSEINLNRAPTNIPCLQ